jgi:hypothetical protein
MHKDRRSSLAIVAALAALALALPAFAATGGRSAPPTTTTQAGDHGSGGTPAKHPPSVQPSGGVAGPAVERGARSAQQPTETEEQPPQVEQPTTPEEQPAPEEQQPTETGGEAPAPSGGQAPAGGGGGGGGLPSTGLELGGLAAGGIGLLLAGWAFRRRPA